MLDLKRLNVGFLYQSDVIVSKNVMMDEESLLKRFCRDIKLDGDGGFEEDCWFRWELFPVPHEEWEELQFHLGDDIHQFYYVYPSDRKIEEVADLTRYEMKPLERIHSYSLKSGMVVTVPDGYTMTPLVAGNVLIIHVPNYDEAVDAEIRKVLESMHEDLSRKGVAEADLPVFMIMDSEVEFMTLQKVDPSEVKRLENAI